MTKTKNFRIKKISSGKYFPYYFAQDEQIEQPHACFVHEDYYARIRQDDSTHRVLLLVDGKWHESFLTAKEITMVQEDLHGRCFHQVLVPLTSGEVVDTGIIDNIKIA